MNTKMIGQSSSLFQSPSSENRLGVGRFSHRLPNLRANSIACINDCSVGRGMDRVELNPDHAKKYPDITGPDLERFLQKQSNQRARDICFEGLHVDSLVFALFLKHP